MRRLFTVSDDMAFLRIVVAVAAALLLLGASAAPAFAQDNINIGDAVQYKGVCQNIIGAVNINRNQIGSTTAITDTDDAADGDAGAGGGTAEAVAVVAQEQGVSIAQVNECLNRVADDGKPAGDGTDDDGVATIDKNKHAVAAAEQYGKDKVIVVSIPKKKALVDTGGVPLSGLALIGLGLVAAGASLVRFGGWH